MGIWAISSPFKVHFEGQRDAKTYITIWCLAQRPRASISTMWGPPVISWFISPSNYSYLRTINHSYWSYWHQLSYRTGASNCTTFQITVSNFFWPCDFGIVALFCGQLWPPLQKISTLIHLELLEFPEKRMGIQNSLRHSTIWVCLRIVYSHFQRIHIY